MPSVLDITKKLIAYPTITPLESGIYEYIQSLLPDFHLLRMDKGGVRNLFLYKMPKHIESTSPSNTTKAHSNRFANVLHLCFAGHIDVVPPGGVWEQDYQGKAGNQSSDIESPLDSKQWKFHPFTPTLQDGYLYGRGAQDMKSGIACFIHAIREYLAMGLEQDFILSVLLTSDEEGEALYGTKYVLEFLKQCNFIPTHCVVAEPTSNNIAGDVIKIGRRGSINGKIHITGKQGHVAYPSKCINPVELLGERLGRLAGVNLDNGSKEFEPSKLVITDIRGGIEAVNVTPSDVRIMFNVRNSTQTTLDSLKKYLDHVLDGLPYTLELQQSAQSFLTTDTLFLEFLESNIAQSYQESAMTKDKTSITRSTSGGTSDARFFSAFGTNVAEVGVCNDRIHAINERVSLQDIERLQKIFRYVLCNFELFSRSK
ncbi:succinyl-diaminopimelate desuccinylase [Helicobacter aurati]|uniref:Succinyl-diaminopimelate desuccinylase n=1 Tax=Helicobacter aurati TaxID=137778 RepID=A0A3D8J7N6_9HELI|nr:succinyl-diaminopimelate desuccinylase [Helicobacter aurati]